MPGTSNCATRTGARVALATCRDVADNIRIFRDCKGYVVAPCHNLQANTPTANVLALYDAVAEFG